MVRTVVIQGHPDPSGNRLCHALAAAYVEGARSAGHKVQQFDTAQLDFPLLRTQEDWQQGSAGTPRSLQEAQAACAVADHLVLIYPLWLGTLPALLKGFLEQVFRPEVALGYGKGFPKPLFRGKSARVVITMGMPAMAYRWFFFAHGLRNLERNILGAAGIGPIRRSLFGLVDGVHEKTRLKWIDTMRSLGTRAR